MGKVLSTREYHLWAVARPSPDVEGQWVGHCLQLDVVTVGDSLEHCFQMLQEASGMVVCDDLNLGRNPLDRADHADPVWKEWARVMDQGTIKSISKTKNQASYLWALRWSVKAALTEMPMPHAMSERDRKARKAPSISTSEVELVLAA